MASQEVVANLTSVIEEIREIDPKLILRPELGEGSLENKVERHLEELYRKMDFATEMAHGVIGDTVNELIGILQVILANMQNMANYSLEDYVTQRDNFLLEFIGQLENLLLYWPPFITAAIEKKRFLEDEGVQKAFDNALEEIKKESSDSISRLQEETDKTIARANEHAQQIETRARRTATGISVEAAQEQFRLAQKDIQKRVRIWSGISAFAALLFILGAWYFSNLEINSEWKWQVIFYTATRVTILVTIGAFAAYSLKILRAYLHMSQHNLHRQRVANSISAFVESAITPEQRDLILTHLVEAVVTFGQSGLVQREDDTQLSSKLTVDTITRNFAATQSKSQ